MNGIGNKQQTEDFNTLLKYCNLTIEEWAAMDFEGRRQAHEIIAEAMEMSWKANPPIKNCGHSSSGL